MVFCMISNTSFSNLLQSVKKNSIIKGTIILTLTGFLTRILGFYYRIFLTNLIGATQLGIYQLVLPVYIVVIAISTIGNEQALTKIISEYIPLNNPRLNQQIFKICLGFCLVISILLSICIYQNADMISTTLLKMPESAACLKLLCLAIPSVSVKGCIHGYFLGYRISSVHGISDLFEQIFKILGVFLVAGYFIHSKYLDATVAIWGLIVGEYASLFYSLICFFRKENILRRNLFPISAPTKNASVSYLKSISVFCKNAIPMTMNRCAISVIQSIEAILIPMQLYFYYNNSSESLSVYGIIMGISFPFIMFPATITNALSTMLMPAVSQASSANKERHLQNMIEQSIHFCLLIGVFSSILFFVFGKDIGICFFHNKESGIYLNQLAFLCPLIYLSTTMASILNGLGYAARNLVQTLLSTLIRIGFILFFVPTIGISGYITGLFVSYVFLASASTYKLNNEVTFQISICKSFLQPCFLFALNGILFSFVYKKSIIEFPGRKTTILFIVVCLYCFTSLLPMLKSIGKAFRQHR